MTSKLRVVIDTNVVVSALLFPESLPGKVFFSIRNRGELILSEAAVKEISEVLRRPKFERYVTAEERDRFLAALIRAARIVQPAERVQVCRDPKDDKWLEIIVRGSASHLITGDADLLQMQSFRGAAILSPTEYIASLQD